MRIKKTSQILLFFFINLFIILTLLQSCKKSDFVQINSKDAKTRFFEIPNNSNPALKRIIDNLKAQESKNHFVENFVKYEGFPIWSSAKISYNHKPGNTYRTEAESVDTIVSVAIVLDGAVYVKDILKIKLDDEILYKLYKGEEYALNGFDKSEERTIENADDVVSQILTFERELFGDRIYKISDTRLFEYFGAGERPSQFFITNRLFSGTVTISWICDWNVGGELTGCPPGVDHCFQLIPVYCNVNYTIFGEEGSSDTGVDWQENIPVSGGGEVPPTPYPPCGALGWEKITIRNDGKYDGPCSQPTTINLDPSIPLIYPPPCDNYVKDLQTDANFIDKFLEFSSPNVLNLNYEKGCIVQNRTHNIYTTKNGTVDDRGGRIEWDGLNNINGTIHSHYQGLAAMFSPGDVISLAQSFIEGEGSDSTNLFIGVTTVLGPYLLKVTDPAMFRTFAEQIYGTTEKVNNFKARFADEFRDPGNANHNEKGFLKMLNKFGVGNGVTLYRGNDDCNHWTALKLVGNANGPDTIEEQACY